MKKLILNRRCAAGRAGDVIEADDSYARRLISRGMATSKQESRKAATRKAAKEE